MSAAARLIHRAREGGNAVRWSVSTEGTKQARRPSENRDAVASWAGVFVSYLAAARIHQGPCASVPSSCRGGVWGAGFVSHAYWRPRLASDPEPSR